MKLNLNIDSTPLPIEIDDVVAGLLATRLNVPYDGDVATSLGRYLSDEAGPWVLDEEHMRKRIFRRVILEVADPALVIRYLMAEKPN
ncbi:MAG: hypothetical protein ACTHKH_08785 [Trinickia sp.]|jgi:hypothetical protein